MTVSNRERLARATEQLRAGLTPYAEREFTAKLGKAKGQFVAARSDPQRKEGTAQRDSLVLLAAVEDSWQEVFRDTLGEVERAYVAELRDVCARWAHDEPLSNDDTDRALDTMRRLLLAVSAGPEADEVERLRVDLQRAVFAEQARNKIRYQRAPLEGTPRAGLRPWRNVVTPHPDVASGRFMQAEFMADLDQVHNGHGSEEYRDPVEFFRRTYLTEGMAELLRGAVLRLTGGGSDPVVELQTNFGGGKTHSMLALYHLFGESPPGALPGVEEVLQRTGVSTLPTTRRAVLVGTALSPRQVRRKADGSKVHTLWGELAWQLGGAESYALVADSDHRGVNPGSQLLAEVFARAAPCLVLVDEWVAYARQLVGREALPAGDFEAQTSFAQSLTEAARTVDRVLLVASIPQSKVEVGGEHGELALETLRNVFQRVARPWRPASGEEGFEIVRRRLFQPISERDHFAWRDAVIGAFARMYKDNPGEFPQNCTDEAYRRELETSYPIHPELLRRLYEDWSTLDRFQRTRGVLRLLAKVVQRLWEGNDAGLMILPAFVPMDDGTIRSELTRYLPDSWEPILAQDIDGESSLPREIDRTTPTLGRVSAARRVARTLYVGTAPGADQARPGIDDRGVRLGCAQPGESLGVFGDALRRLCDRGRYIHQDGSRVWVSTRANLNRLADERAVALRREVERLHEEIVRRLRRERDARRRGDFVAVHVAPASTADVPDDPEARLVLLGPERPHRKAEPDSPALTFARAVLQSRGGAPRIMRNALVFLAADRKELETLEGAVAQHLAWTSIVAERDALNLDPLRHKQAEARRNEADAAVESRLLATWVHALVPYQSDPSAEPRWQEVRVSGGDGLARRTSAKLRAEEFLLVALDRDDGLGRLGGQRLRVALDRGLWEKRDHVRFDEIVEWFPRFLFLPRVRDVDTLARAVQDAVTRAKGDDAFALAQSYDDATGSYGGLHVGAGGTLPVIEPGTLIVKLDVARQRAAQNPRASTAPERNPVVSDSEPESRQPSPKTLSPGVFEGAVRLKTVRVGHDAERVAEEVLRHLATLPGAASEVTLVIRVTLPGGAPEEVRRTVTENARTLGFEFVRFGT